MMRGRTGALCPAASRSQPAPLPQKRGHTAPQAARTPEQWADGDGLGPGGRRPRKLSKKRQLQLFSELRAPRIRLRTIRSQIHTSGSGSASQGLRSASHGSCSAPWGSKSAIRESGSESCRWLPRASERFRKAGSLLCALRISLRDLPIQLRDPGIWLGTPGSWSGSRGARSERYGTRSPVGRASSPRRGPKRSNLRARPKTLC